MEQVITRDEYSQRKGELRDRKQLINEKQAALKRELEQYNLDVRNLKKLKKLKTAVPIKQEPASAGLTIPETLVLINEKKRRGTLLPQLLSLLQAQATSVPVPVQAQVWTPWEGKTKKKKKSKKKTKLVRKQKKKRKKKNLSEEEEDTETDVEDENEEEDEDVDEENEEEEDVDEENDRDLKSVLQGYRRIPIKAQSFRRHLFVDAEIVKLFTTGWYRGKVVALRPNRVRSNCEVNWEDEDTNQTRNCLLKEEEYFRLEVSASNKATVGAWFFIEHEN
jgi:hypothetical protein